MARANRIRHHTTSAKPAIRIILAPLRRAWHLGEAEKRRRTVWIDPRQPWPTHTLLHELIHVENPSWSETAVRRETARQWRAMTWRGRAALLRMLGRAVIGRDAE